MKIGIVEHVDCAHSAIIKSQKYPLHGHTYQIEVAVEGEVKDGIVFDFCDLREVTKKVLAWYDKKNLNELLDNSTGENFALALHRDLKKVLPKTLKVFVKLWQGNNKWVEYGD